MTTDGAVFSLPDDVEWCATVYVYDVNNLDYVFVADGDSASTCGSNLRELGCLSNNVEDAKRDDACFSSFKVCSETCHDECVALTDCESCMADTACGWCASSGTCLNGDAGGPLSAQCSAWRWNTDPNDSRLIARKETSFPPVKTETLDVFLADGDTLQTEITIALPCDGYNVDVSVLLDRSDAGDSVLSGYDLSWETLFDSLSEEDRISLHTFVDVPVRPFGTSLDYVYRQHTSLITAKAEHKKYYGSLVSELTTLNGDDVPQGQLSALSAFAKNRDNLVAPRYGYAMRIAIVMTASPYHAGGSHPSVAETASDLLEAGIFPVFLVSANVLADYKTLVDQLGFGLVMEVRNSFEDAGIKAVEAIKSAMTSVHVAHKADGDILFDSPPAVTDISPGSTLHLPVGILLNFKKRAEYDRRHEYIYVVGWGVTEVIAGKDDTPHPEEQRHFIEREDEPVVLSTIITLRGSAFYTDELQPIVSRTVDKGALYQVSGPFESPVRGELIKTGDDITDPLWRVMFNAVPDANGKPYTYFKWILRDSCGAQNEGTVYIDVDPIEDLPRTYCENNKKTVAAFNEDTSVVVQLDGYDPDDSSNKVGAKISSFPKGKLYNYDVSNFIDGTGSQITTASPYVSNTELKVVYKPVEDYHGDDAFSYESTKTGLEGKELDSFDCTILLTIKPVNDPPFPHANPDIMVGKEDTDLLIELHCDDVDVEECFMRITTFPTKGSLWNVDGNMNKADKLTTSNRMVSTRSYDTRTTTSGWVIYDPESASGFGEKYDNFWYEAEDPHGAISTFEKQIWITLEFVNDPPTTNPPDPIAPQTLEDTEIVIRLTGQDEETSNPPIYITSAPDQNTEGLRGTLYQVTGTATRGAAINLKALPVRVTNAAGAVIYLPPQDEFGNAGEVYASFGFAVIEDDTPLAAGLRSPERAVPVIVLPVNDQPIATTRGHFELEEDSSVDVELKGEDDYFGETPRSELQYVIKSLPTNGVISDSSGVISTVDYVVDSTNTVTYKPNAHVNGKLMDSISYQTWDSNSTANLGYSATKEISFTVKPKNDIPVAASDSIVGCEDYDLTVCVGAKDPDMWTDNFGRIEEHDVIITITPAKGQSFLMNEQGGRGAPLKVGDVLPRLAKQTEYHAGCFIYVPVPNEWGNVYDTFTFFVVDGLGAQSTVMTVPIDIVPVNDPPHAAGGDVEGNEDETITIDTLDGWDDLTEGHAITGVVKTLPDKGKLYQFDNTLITTPNTAITDPDLKLKFHPGLHESGSPYTSFEFYVVDKPDPHSHPNPPEACATVVALQSPDVTVKITIHPLPDVPSLTYFKNFQTCENEMVDITIEAEDPENDDMYLFIVDLPDDGKILFDGTEITQVPAELGKPQTGTGKWVVEYWPDDKPLTYANRHANDNNGIGYAIPVFKVYDGDGASPSERASDVAKKLYPRVPITVDVLPKNDPPTVFINHNNGDGEGEVILEGDRPSYGLNSVYVADSDADFADVTVIITANIGTFEVSRSRDEDQNDQTFATNDVSELTTILSDDRREITFIGTLPQINAILPKTFWVSPAEADTSGIAANITIFVDDNGSTGSPGCDDDETSANVTVKLGLTYESLGSTDIAPYVVAGALGAGVFVVVGAVAATYKILRMVKAVDGVQPVAVEGAIFDGAMDNPIWESKGATQDNMMYDGKI
eukprot:TRINITY_DN1081_c0_g1_i1.p1 TRINITY_DN1081_c0_g1~~TRINITY_DN1081_c0_g1_i1.p1  ORF type:complete len:1787 (+),score=353.85 TRINITY_DN1081_c0_g1_i1:335-5362(+)